TRRSSDLSASVPSSSPWASSCTKIPARVFSSPLRATAGGVRARFGNLVPGRRLDELGRREVRAELGDLVHVGAEPPAMSWAVWAEVEVYLRENDHVHFQDGVRPMLVT